MVLADIRQAFRGLVKNPGVTAIVVTCLALGIGINATLFAVVDGVMIQSLPFADPDSLVIVNENFQRGGIRRSGVSYQDLKDFRERTSTLTTVAATTTRSYAIADGDVVERYQGAAITYDMLSMLGVPPALGRHFVKQDDVPGAEAVAIVGDAIWRVRFHSDPNIIGRKVMINGTPTTIVGVMPQNFGFPENEELWVPLGPTAESQPRPMRNLFTFGRLKPGATLSTAREDIAKIADALAKEYPQFSDGWSAGVRPAREEFIPDDVRLILFTMMGAVTLVLMVACANVANLMLARASGRQREFAVRASLGAGRARLARQLFTECIVLGLLAAPIGLAIAYLGLYLLDNAVPRDQVPYYIRWAIDWRSSTYTVVISTLTGLVFGLAPALQAGRLNLVETLRDGARGAGSSGRRARWRNGLVVIEVALTLVLLVGASLFVRSFYNLEGADPGFDTKPLMTLRFYMTGDAYQQPDAMARRVDDIVRRIESVPGVQSAFASNFVPLGGGGGGGNAIIDGKPVASGEEPGFGFNAVTPHVYQTMGLKILKGRTFTDAEGASRSAVAVISETMAKKMWPNEDPVGRRFRRRDGEPSEWITVIGVAQDIRRFSMDDDSPPFPECFVPYVYGQSANTGVTIRANVDPASIVSAVRAEIRASDTGLPLFDVRTMEGLRTIGFWQYRLFGQMFGIFGAAALFLATIGVYGVLSFSVSQRTQELGVRIALGAQRGAVLGMVVRQGLVLALVGVGVGLVGAFGITRVIQSLLYNVSATDPLSFVAVSAFLLAIGLVASYFPARRATAVDPIVALRSE